MHSTPQEVNASIGLDLSNAEEMSKTREFLPTPIPEDMLVIDVLKRLPFLTGFLRNMIEARNAESTLATATSNISPDPPEAIKNIQFVGLALRIVDFIRIPLIYLAAFAWGEKPPITLSNNGKWLYAASLLALCIVALSLPVTAPIIAIVAPALVLAVSLFSLGKLSYDYRQNKTALEQVTKQLNEESIHFKLIQENALSLKALLEKAIDEKDDTLAEKLSSNVKTLRNTYNEQKDTIQKLTDQKYMLEEKMKIESDFMDRSIGICFASLTVIGAVTSLFFPPAGLGILIATGLASGAYAIAKLAAPYVAELGNKGLPKSPPLDDDSHKNMDSLSCTTSSAQMLRQLGGPCLTPQDQTQHHKSPPISSPPIKDDPVPAETPHPKL